VNGDSLVVIQAMFKSTRLNLTLASILLRIDHHVARFHKVKFFQVMREQNLESDQLANEATREKFGVLTLNGSRHFQAIP
jgi:hypothetical protein